MQGWSNPIARRPGLVISEVGQVKIYLSVAHGQLDFSSLPVLNYYHEGVIKSFFLWIAIIFYLLIRMFGLPADCFAEGKLDTCFLKTLHISVQPVFILLFCY